MNSFLRNAVAGAARSLWMNFNGSGLEQSLKAMDCLCILHLEAVHKLAEKYPDMHALTLGEYAQLVSIRRQVADAAAYLVEYRGADQVWLMKLSNAQIVTHYEGAKAADMRLSGFREESGGRFINPMTGLRMHGTVSDVERTYTLEDLRKAYLLAWDNSGEGWNGEIQTMPTDSEQWLAERDEALRLI